LYCLSALTGSLIDDATISGFTFFILGFAAIELSIGLLLLVYLKYLNVGLNLSNDFNNFTLSTAPLFMRAALQRSR
jgi:NADH:ubiquinone oxidoreductase subunit K